MQPLMEGVADDLTLRLREELLPSMNFGTCLAVVLQIWEGLVSSNTPLTPETNNLSVCHLDVC